MKRVVVLQLILTVVSGVIGLGFLFASKVNPSQMIGKGGELTVKTNGDVSCVVGAGDECHASGCSAPDISTECSDPDNDHQTTLNEN